MKYLTTVILLICVLLCLSDCRLNYMEPREMDAYLDDVAGKIGDSQITEDDDLIGHRDLSDDAYCGSYVADCNSQTGRDVIFGGASIHEKELRCYGSMQSKEGTAEIRIRLNNEVSILQTDEAGNFETEIYLKSGGNYIMIDYSDFTGSIEMICEYSEGGRDENNL